MNEELKAILKDKAAAKEMKKMSIKLADSAVTVTKASKSGKETKEAETKAETEADVINKSFIANTYNYIDSHNDIHVKGCFTKSINERSEKIFHLTDHSYKVSAKVGEPTKLQEKTITWKEAGLDIEGNTTALVMSSDIYKDYNNSVFTQYNNGKVNQHSIGFYYVKLDLAINNPEEKEEFKVWNEFYSSLGNPEIADAKGFFWVCREGKLQEVSSVLAGSNDLTGMLDNKEEVNSEEDKPTEEQKNKPNNSIKMYY
jgi:hypothetical protein